jgi:hypothetical protein
VRMGSSAEGNRAVTEERSDTKAYENGEDAQTTRQRGEDSR